MTPKELYMPTIMGHIRPLLTEAGFKLQRNKFFKRHTEDIDILIWPMIIPRSDVGELTVNLTLYVYSDRIARLGRMHMEPTREWYASAIDVSVASIMDRRISGALSIRSLEQAESAGRKMATDLTQLVFPLIARISNADDICNLMEEYGYRLFVGRPEAIAAWISRYREAAGSSLS